MHTLQEPQLRMVSVAQVWQWSPIKACRTLDDGHKYSFDAMLFSLLVLSLIIERSLQVK